MFAPDELLAALADVAVSPSGTLWAADGEEADLPPASALEPCSSSGPRDVYEGRGSIRDRVAAAGVARLDVAREVVAGVATSHGVCGAVADGRWPPAPPVPADADSGRPHAPRWEDALESAARPRTPGDRDRAVGHWRPLRGSRGDEASGALDARVHRRETIDSATWAAPTHAAVEHRCVIGAAVQRTTAVAETG